MKKYLMIAIIIALALLNITQFLCNNSRHRLIGDAVPDESTAIAVGKAVLVAAYGEGVLYNEPFVARYSDNKKCWIVSGTWPDDPNLIGGIGAAFIRRSDGKVLYICHCGACWWCSP